MAFSCSYCPFTSDAQNNLKTHTQRIHNKIVKALECCDVCFPDKASLQQHTTTFHHPQFKCTVCDRRFYTPFLLRRHQIVHFERTEFKSSPCEYDTVQESYLKRHLKIHKLKGESTPVSVKSYQVPTYTPVKDVVDSRETSHNWRHDVVDSPAIAVEPPFSQGLSSSQSLHVLSNAIREEARQLRSQILLASTISAVLSLLERLLELSTSIADHIRVSVDGEPHSQAIECFKYVWDTSELAVLRWKYVDDSTNRKSFLRAVQYAFSIFPAISHPEINKHLEIMENIILLIINTIRNYQRQSSFDQTAMSNQSLPVLSNVIREEARQLKSWILPAAPISSKLSLLERLLELSATIANQIRGFMADEICSEAAECLEYVWAVSKMAVGRWGEMEDSMNRQTFLRAVQYAFAIFPVTFINLPMNNLEIMRHIMLLIINTVKNCQRQWENAKPGQSFSKSRLLWEGF